MNAKTKRDSGPTDPSEEVLAVAEGITVKRDRLLASLTLIAGIATIIGLPFALPAGAEFFMPVTAALVVAIALVPMLLDLTDATGSSADLVKVKITRLEKPS